jgi:hypothetical protein
MLTAVEVWNLVRIVTWAVGVPVIVWLTLRAVGTWRRIQRLHEELLREEAQNPKDPYARLAEIESAKQLLQGNRRRPRG